MSAIRSLPARTRSASHLGVLREVTTNTDEQNDTADNYSDPEEVDIEVVNVRSFKERSWRERGYFSFGCYSYLCWWLFY